MHIFELDFFERKVIKSKVEKKLPCIENKADAYYQREIPKRKDKENRILHCIKNESTIYEVQKMLKNNFFDLIPLSEYCYGYRTGKSYKDYLVPHSEGKYYLRLDIKNFFDTITKDLIRNVLDYYVNPIPIRPDFSLLDFIIEVVTLHGTLPQGAVTSPVLSNIVFRQLDVRISKYCDQNKTIYTRYADDLLFSSNNKNIHQPSFIRMISKILASNGFEVNLKKTKRTKDVISLNGFVVNSGVHISRKKKYFLSTILFCYRQSKPSDWQSLRQELMTKHNINFENDWKLHNFISGYRSFLIGWIPLNSIGELNRDLSNYDEKNIRLAAELETLLLTLNPCL